MKRFFPAFSTPAGKLSILFSILFLGCFLFLSRQSTAGSLLTRQLMTQKLPRAAAAEIGLKLLNIHPYGVRELYAAMMYFSRIQKDPGTALLFAEAIQKGVTPAYGNIEGFKGDFLLQLGKIEEAGKAYWQEGQNYPLSVIPIYKLMRIASLQGAHAQAQKLNENLTARMKARNINTKMLHFILQNPYYDLHPWMVPKSHGGPESERSFKFQKIGTVNAGETF